MTTKGHSLTQKQLKELLHYDPDTGEFTWLSYRALDIRAGTVAGSVHRTGYIFIQINRTKHLAHRLAWLYMNGCFPPNNIDHINHKRHDNRILNLKCATSSENNRNRTLQANNKSGVIGVCKVTCSGKWVAQITIDRKRIYLGAFNNKVDAIIARKMAEYKYGFHKNHGEEP